MSAHFGTSGAGAAVEETAVQGVEPTPVVAQDMVQDSVCCDARFAVDLEETTAGIRSEQFFVEGFRFKELGAPGYDAGLRCETLALDTGSSDHACSGDVVQGFPSCGTGEVTWQPEFAGLLAEQDIHFDKSG